jgi:hypothetical protein
VLARPRDAAAHTALLTGKKCGGVKFKSEDFEFPKMAKFQFWILRYNLSIMNALPPKGYYIHYKHDPDGSLYNYMYEIVGIGRNTEEKTLTVLYRPLYQNDWMPPADYQSRPLDMFMEYVEKDGQSIPRFNKITNAALIAELDQQRRIMYPE